MKYNELLAGVIYTSIYDKRRCVVFKKEGVPKTDFLGYHLRDNTCTLISGFGSPVTFEEASNIEKSLYYNAMAPYTNHKSHMSYDIF